jgi:hypothetical protein
MTALNWICADQSVFVSIANFSRGCRNSLPQHYRLLNGGNPAIGFQIAAIAREAE